MMEMYGEVMDEVVDEMLDAFAHLSLPSMNYTSCQYGLSSLQLQI